MAELELKPFSIVLAGVAGLTLSMANPQVLFCRTTGFFRVPEEVGTERMDPGDRPRLRLYPVGMLVDTAMEWESEPAMPCGTTTPKSMLIESGVLMLMLGVAITRFRLFTASMVRGTRARLLEMKDRQKQERKIEAYLEKNVGSEARRVLDLTREERAAEEREKDSLPRPFLDLFISSGTVL